MDLPTTGSGQKGSCKCGAAVGRRTCGSEFVMTATVLVWFAVAGLRHMSVCMRARSPGCSPMERDELDGPRAASVKHRSLPSTVLFCPTSHTHPGCQICGGRVLVPYSLTVRLAPRDSPQVQCLSRARAGRIACARARACTTEMAEWPMISFAVHAPGPAPYLCSIHHG